MLARLRLRRPDCGVRCEAWLEKPTYLTSVLITPLFTPVSLKESIVK